MAIRNSLAIRKSIAVLTVITAMFTVACESDEDPGTDVGDVDVTEPAGDLGGDTATTGGEMTTTTAAGG